MNPLWAHLISRQLGKYIPPRFFGTARTRLHWQGFRGSVSGLSAPVGGTVRQELLDGLDAWRG